MKKSYSAPKLLIERFELKNRITQSCSSSGSGSGGGKSPVRGTPSLADKASCGWKIGEGMILWPSAPSCTMNTPVDGAIGTLCYNAPNVGGGGGSPFIS